MGTVNPMTFLPVAAFVVDLSLDVSDARKDDFLVIASVLGGGKKESRELLAGAGAGALAGVVTCSSSSSPSEP